MKSFHLLLVSRVSFAPLGCCRPRPRPSVHQRRQIGKNKSDGEVEQCGGGGGNFLGLPACRLFHFGDVSQSQFWHTARRDASSAIPRFPQPWRGLH